MAGTLVMLLPMGGHGQTLDNTSLNGKYFFRHILFQTDASGAISRPSSLSGSITFDGLGKTAVQGQQTVGTASPVNFTSAGTYQVQPNGFVTITNPQRSDSTLNARLGVGAMVGSSTEAAGTVSDVFVAVPASKTPATNQSFLGTYRVATFEIPLGDATQARSAFFTWYGNGQGGFDPFTVTGHAANLNSQVLTQTVTGATYDFSSDGSATATFPAPSGASPGSMLLGGKKVLYLSADGSMMIGGSLDAGGHDLIVAISSLTTAATNNSLQGVFYTAGLALGTQGLSSYAGSANSPGTGTILFTRRYHSVQGTLDFTSSAAYTLLSDGSGTSGTLRVGLGSGGAAFLNSSVSDFDLKTFEIDVAIRAPSITGSGVFVSPVGIVNAASFGPVGNPLSPGEIFSIFGIGLAPQTLAADHYPLPPSLAGVQVLVNNSAAPLIAVSTGLVNAVVPNSASGTKVTIVVNNNGRRSNAVDVPLAKTAPGVFTLDSSGAGAGAILHPDYSLVTAAAPAKHGETVQIYLTGLGATAPPVGDGLPASGSNLSVVTADVAVYIGGKAAPVVFKGLAPGFAALYQLNVTVPADAPSGAKIPLAIGTADSFHDQVDISIQ